MRLHYLLLGLTLAATQAHAQWDIEESHTTASLRGIHNVGAGVAWASGTNGTVLRTEDGGYLWQTCNIPPGAEKLDFRGIQAFDENTAIVMSSGTGDLSRLYKTTDGCQTWKLLFTNPDKDGFWDAIQFRSRQEGYLIGDPVDGRFRVFKTQSGGAGWDNFWNGVQATPKEGAFAASNSSLSIGTPSYQAGSEILFGTGSSLKARVIRLDIYGSGDVFSANWNSVDAPLAANTSAAGIFSLAFFGKTGIAVGGDYLKPNDTQGTSAFTKDGGKSWTPAQTTPHGFRSAVVYDAEQKLWITVGPNGTDISRDDGKNWEPLKPSGYGPSDADKNWNALSLPFVVGPHGRIGRLRTIDTPKK